MKSDRLVLITGASSGIGEGIARAVSYTIAQPDEVNELTIRPTAQQR